MSEHRVLVKAMNRWITNLEKNDEELVYES